MLIHIMSWCLQPLSINHTFQKMKTSKKQSLINNIVLLILEGQYFSQSVPPGKWEMSAISQSITWKMSITSPGLARALQTDDLKFNFSLTSAVTRGFPGCPDAAYIILPDFLHFVYIYFNFHTVSMKLFI